MLGAQDQPVTIGMDAAADARQLSDPLRFVSPLRDQGAESLNDLCMVHARLLFSHLPAPVGEGEGRLQLPTDPIDPSKRIRACVLKQILDHR